MLKRFFSKSPQKRIEQGAGSDYIEPQKAERLLNTDRRKILLDLIWEQTSMSKDSYQRLYLAPISRFAELVQQFPASENHHHAYQGGLLDHSLELMLHALRLRQSYLLPMGAPPEDQSHQTEAWSAACAYGGLLHDGGKPAVDLLVELQGGEIWHPWAGAINKPYRFRYITNRDYKLHDSALGLVYVQILGPEILTWLCRYQELWSNFLNLMSGNYEEAGAIGEIVAKADRVSTAQNMGSNPEKVLNAPINTLQKQLLMGIRHLLKNDLRLNQKGAAGWLTQDALWMVSKPIADKLRAYLLQQGYSGVPGSNSGLFDELQSHGLIEASPSGKAIWNAEVRDGDWKQEFTFLRFRPSLVWAGEPIPRLFSGQIELLDNEPAQVSTDTVASALTQSPTPASPAQPASPVTLATAPENQPVQGAVEQETDNSIDDALNLFSDIMPTQQHTNQTEHVAAQPPLSSPPPQVSTEEILSDSPIAEAQREVVSQTSQPRKTAPRHTVSELEAQGRKELAERFMVWLKDAILHNKLQINDANAPLHIVDGHLFLVTPKIFQRFITESTGDQGGDTWRKLQKGFEKLKVHKKRGDDLNIWYCKVEGPRKKGKPINGYLLDANQYFASVPMDNPFLKLDP
jgi:integrating conjugative element relaxase, PFL_4751 family